MILKVIQDYKSPSNCENPIELQKGDIVQLGEVSDPNGEYPNWVYCTCQNSDKAGWVAVGVLNMENGIGTALQDYTSKEMTVFAGDKVDTIYELNGWYWCKRLSDDELGWGAKDNLDNNGKNR